MSLPSIEDTDVAGRIVLVRADLNTPMHGCGVGDRTRITRFAPTVADLLRRGAGVVVISHLGRPRGEINLAYTLAPVAKALEEELGQKVQFASDCVGANAEMVTGGLKPGMVALLENLRFHKGEEANDNTFALMLSVHGDIYVDDAFSCAHRAHASTDAITRYMPSFAGPSLIAEVEALERALDKPERPSAALVGGAKISTKIDVLRHIVKKVDRLIIGGAMANTFLAARGHAIGRSLVETSAIGIANQVTEAAARSNCVLILPDDVVVATEFAANAPHSVVDVDAIPDDAMALDIGPRSVARIKEALDTSRTLLWNGPLGAFETEPFGAATFAVARHAAALTKAGRLTSIAGGGDTAAALAAAGVAGDFTHLSTAGGAFLEWIEGKSLPGIDALRSREPALENS